MHLNEFCLFSLYAHGQILVKHTRLHKSKKYFLNRNCALDALMAQVRYSKKKLDSSSEKYIVFIKNIFQQSPKEQIPIAYENLKLHVTHIPL